ncbi:MAG: glutathione S-transferase family protein [Burkholderiales bacterium]
MKVYWGSGSPFAWRVLLALEFKGLAYESRRLSFDRREHKSPEYLKLNPRGQVPALTDGGFAIYESVAILSYLDRKYPGKPLFGRTPEEHGAIMRWVSEIGAYVESAGLPIPRTAFFSEWNDAARAAVGKAVERIVPELEKIEQQLASTPWLVDGACSAADICLYPLLEIFWRASMLLEKKGGHPALARIARPGFTEIDRWCGEIARLPGYERTYPPHWRQS